MHRTVRLSAWALGISAAAVPAMAGSYAPAAGQPGSTAIAHTDPSFVDWASGWVNYLPGTNVDATWKDVTKALGPSTGDNFDVVSLGDSGQVTLTFDHPVIDGPGADFAVFENSLNDTFLELAWVEVSADGTNFVRFTNYSLTANPVPFFGGSVDPANITGLAGKYRLGYGTPFDLADVGLSQINYVRLVDVIGDGTALDSAGHAIYDPAPTSGSGGFDLEAVGVINTPEPSSLTLLAGAALLGRRSRRTVSL